MSKISKTYPTDSIKYSQLILSYTDKIDMLQIKKLPFGLEINSSATINFSQLEKISNSDILKLGGKEDQRLESFMQKKMGIEYRYWAPENVYAYDLAKEALGNLIKKDSSLIEKSDFLIFCGISNSLPTVCHASLLSSEFSFKQASCFDIKSGCSSGVLGLILATNWFNNGAKQGIIVCSETLSKFTDKTSIQMSGSVGDGAIAFSVSRSDKYEILSAIQGTDSEFFKSMYVKSPFPVDTEKYKKSDYTFTLTENAAALKRSEYHWSNSLKELLSIANLAPRQVNYYFPHQVDGLKNLQLAKDVGIPEQAIYMNFKNYGNIGCPSVFLNYHVHREQISLKPNDHIVFHVVGGGQSWAGICQRKKA